MDAFLTHKVVKSGGMPDYILAAIPFFLFLMLVELILTILSKVESAGGRYAVDDAWSSLTGIVCIRGVFCVR